MNGSDTTTLIGMAAVVLGTIALALLMKHRLLRKARRIEGQPAPDTSAIDDGCDSANRVYYLYSQHCGPCRSVTPRIDELRKRHPNLIKLDVRAHPDLARGFNAMATPSFVHVRDGRVIEVKLGPARNEWLLERLKSG
jgi:thioredoxin 1